MTEQVNARADFQSRYAFMQERGEEGGVEGTKKLSRNDELKYTEQWQRTACVDKFENGVCRRRQFGRNVPRKGSFRNWVTRDYEGEG